MPFDLRYNRRMGKPALSAVLALLFGLVFGLALAADTNDDVRCQEIAFSKSVENKDVDAFRSFLDEDARFVGRVVTRGPAEIVAAWQAFFSADGPTIKWRPQYVEVREDGELALTRGPYRMLSKDAEGNPLEYWGTFNSVWHKTPKGRWRVIFDAGNTAAGPPDEETRALLEQDDDCP